MRWSEQDASNPRRVITQLHRPVKLKLRRTIFLNFLRPLVLSDRRDFFMVSYPAAGQTAPVGVECPGKDVSAMDPSSRRRRADRRRQTAAWTGCRRSGLWP